MKKETDAQGKSYRQRRTTKGDFLEPERQERVRAEEMFLKACVIHQLVTGKPGRLCT